MVFAHGRGLPQVFVPGLRDLRGYRAMYRDFAAAIRTGRAPEMSLERALDDQHLMEQVYATAAPAPAPTPALTLT
jgi:predicted dehydrogenase